MVAILQHPAFGYMEVPEYFKEADESEIFAVCNGCGAAGKFDFVPDTIYGLSIRPACFVHDYDYFLGVNENQRRAADYRFLTNMLMIIDYEGHWSLRWLRRRRAYKYFEAVRAFGARAFWANKEGRY